MEQETKKIKRKEKKKKRQSGFTLIEIMVVVMIIGMLAALVGVNVYNRFIKASRGVAVAQIRNFMTALDSYYLDNRMYPTTEQGLQALSQKPTSSPVPKSYPEGGYLNEIPLDPWRNEYVYNRPGVQGGPYSVESYGADGIDGGEGENADIESWRLSAEQQGE